MPERSATGTLCKWAQNNVHTCHDDHGVCSVVSDLSPKINAHDVRQMWLCRESPLLPGIKQSNTSTSEM